MKNSKKYIVDGQELRFIRCDKDGNELSREELSQMSFTNSTIDRLVTETAGRLGAVSDADGGFLDGFRTL